jgi:hypothetical protein
MPHIINDVHVAREQSSPLRSNSEKRFNQWKLSPYLHATSARDRRMDGWMDGMMSALIGKVFFSLYETLAVIIKVLIVWSN